MARSDFVGRRFVEIWPGWMQKRRSMKKMPALKDLWWWRHASWFTHRLVVKTWPTVFNKVGLMERHLLLQLSPSLPRSLSHAYQSTEWCFHLKWTLLPSSMLATTVISVVNIKHHSLVNIKHRYNCDVLSHLNVDALWNKVTKITIEAAPACYACTYACCMFTTCVWSCIRENMLS